MLPQRAQAHLCHLPTQTPPRLRSLGLLLSLPPTSAQPAHAHGIY